jgi:hypothetical protein
MTETIKMFLHCKETDTRVKRQTTKWYTCDKGLINSIYMDHKKYNSQKNQQPNEQIIFRRRFTNGHKIHEEMLIISGHK